MIIRTEKIKNYTKIDNKYLEDKNISLKAKGLLTLMLSLPDSWKFNVNGLRLLCKESRYAITNTLKELEDNRYLIIEKGHSTDGKFLYTYTIFKEQYTQKGHLVLPYMDN